MKKTLMTIAFAVIAAASAPEASAQEFQVVVNASVSVSEISSGDLSKIFQKKSNDIGGTRAVPVDLESGSSVREAFSQAIHGRSASAIESFWQQQIFSGKDVPPEQKGSDAEVLAFVSSTPGAVGYVSAGASVPGGVKVLSVSQ